MTLYTIPVATKWPFITTILCVLLLFKCCVCPKLSSGDLLIVKGSPKPVNSMVFFNYPEFPLTKKTNKKKLHLDRCACQKGHLIKELAYSELLPLRRMN